MLRIGLILLGIVGASSVPARVYAGAEDAVPSETFVPAPWGDSLEQEIEDIRKSYSGEIAAYVSDPYRGYRFGFNAARPFYLASGVKVAFMVEVFRQRELGRLSFDEELTYDASDIRDGAPRLNGLRVGARVSISRLLDYMMRSSDNAASDMLAKRVGLTNVSAGLQEEGIEGFTPLTYLIDVRRGIYRNLDVAADDLEPAEVRKIRWTRIWRPQIRELNRQLGVPPRTYDKDDLLRAYDAFYATGVNAAPMASVGLLFEKMLRDELVSKRASREMLELMSRSRTSTHRILGRLPRRTRVAHKTGSQFNRLCDLGVVFLPNDDDRAFVVTVCTADGGVKESEAAVARIARTAYDLVRADHRRAATRVVADQGP